MNDRENRRLQMLVRVRDFCLAHAADFGSASLFATLIAALAASITRIEAFGGQQASKRGAAQEGTSLRAVARAALRDALEAIRRTARALGQDIPGLDDKFHIPQSANDQLLLMAARAALTDARPLEAQFVAHEMPADFLADLRDRIAALETAIAHQSAALQDGVGARVGLDEELETSVGIVRKLDPIIRNKYANDPVNLAEWTSASHTERAAKHKAKPTPPLTSGAGGSTPPPA